MLYCEIELYLYCWASGRKRNQLMRPLLLCVGQQSKYRHISPTFHSRLLLACKGILPVD